MTDPTPEERAAWRRQVDVANEHDMGHVWLWRAGLLLDAADKADRELVASEAAREEAERQRDEAQEHVAYHLRDFVPGDDDQVTGDLAVDMTRYADRMKARADKAEQERDEAEEQTNRIVRQCNEADSRAACAEARVAELEAERDRWKKAAETVTENAAHIGMERDALEVRVAAIGALIGPDDVFPDWAKYPHMYRVTSRHDGYTRTVTVVEVDALRRALTEKRA